MRKLFTLILLFSLGLVTHLGAQSGTSSDPFVALEGTNTSFFNGSYLYYKLIMPCDGKITFSTVGLTNDYIEVYMYNDSSVSTTASGHGVELTFLVGKGDSVSFRIYTNSSQVIIPWSLSITKEEILVGSLCDGPLQASLGENAADNSNGDQWYVYTPATNCNLILSTVGLTDEDTYVELYSSCGGKILTGNDDYSDYQSYISYQVTAGTTYHIRWRNRYTKASYTWSLSTSPLSSATNLTYFNLWDGNNSKYSLYKDALIDTVDHTVTAYVSKDLDLGKTGLYAIMGISSGATIAENGSDLSDNWYLNSSYYYSDEEIFKDSTYTYTITAKNGTTSKDWKITVLNSASYASGNNFISYTVAGTTGVIDTVNHTVKVDVPDTDLSSLYASFSLSPMATAYISGTEQSSGGYLDFSDTVKYTITAENGVSQNWKVIVAVAKGLACNDPKVATIGANAGIGTYNQYFSFTPAATGYYTLTVNSSYYYPHTSVYTSCGSASIASGYIYQGDSVTFEAEAGTTYILYLGDLYSDSLIITTSTAAGVNCSNAVVATEGTTYGNGDYTQYFSFTAEKSGYVTVGSTNDNGYNYVYTGDCEDLSAVTYGYNAIFYAKQDTTYTIQTYYLLNDGLTINYNTFIQKDITYFEIKSSYSGWESADVDTVNNNISLTVDPEVDLTNLQIYFYRTNYLYTEVSVGGSVISSYDYLDFSKPLTFTITAIDGTVATYTVTITKRAVYTGKNFLAYVLTDQTGDAIIDPDTHTIKIAIDTTGGFNVTSLVPYFALSIGAYATDEDSVVQASGSTARDFSADTVKYDVYAEDSSVVRWNVIPVLGDTILKNNQADIAAYHFYINGESITINSDNKTVSVVLPYGSDISNVASGFTLSKGATASIGTAEQASGITVNNFSSAVVYTITAEDGTTAKDWKITVTFAKNTETDITAYSLVGQTSSTVDATNHAISVVMPYGTTDITGLVATYTLSDQATVAVNGEAQISGTTSNNFTSLVTYTITAGDNTTVQNWIVTVTIKDTTIISILTDVSSATSIVAYPNPNNGSFRLKVNSSISKAKVTIVSIDGKCVYSKEVAINDNTTESIDLNVAAGTYIVTVVSGDSISKECIQVIR
jgi:hypothetical protein